MTELPDYNKITFPEMPPIPLEKLVPDATPEVSNFDFVDIVISKFASLEHCSTKFSVLVVAGCGAFKEVFGVPFQVKSTSS